MAENELVFKSGQDLAALIKSRKVSPVEVAQAFLDRADALNPRVNAFITVTAERARQDARAAEQTLLRNAQVGPLFGVPYAPKDILET